MIIAPTVIWTHGSGASGNGATFVSQANHICAAVNRKLASLPTINTAATQRFPYQ